MSRNAVHFVFAGTATACFTYQKLSSVDNIVVQSPAHQGEIYSLLVPHPSLASAGPKNERRGFAQVSALPTRAPLHGAHAALSPYLGAPQRIACTNAAV